MQVLSERFRSSDGAVLSGSVQLCREVSRGCSLFQAKHNPVTCCSKKPINMNRRVSGKLQRKNLFFHASKIDACWF